MNVRRTYLSFFRNLLQDQARLLSVGANLLEILGGLVKIGGSAYYLNEPKSNSSTRVLMLRVETEECRLLFAEMGIATGVLEGAMHFVSSVTYGGNLIIDMTLKYGDKTGSVAQRQSRYEDQRTAGVTELNNLIWSDIRFDGVVVNMALSNQPTIYLFLMTRLQNPDANVVHYFALLRNSKAWLPQSHYIFYVEEDPSELVVNLPGGEAFS
ncbi:hypothetical protein EDC04DRAFT_2904722 [Pisolithus marmoratus]|nr:hypothetical protein EDC04DRAFT_2904722 [Pisolithus marmoratus]